jgi:hypothetical protein
MRRLSLLLVAALVLAPAGCGGARSRVHGTVRYKGQPLTNATIIFLAPDNQAYPVRLGKDGAYEVASLPRGRIQVAIQADEPRVPPRPAPKAGKGGDEFAATRAREDDAAKQRGGPAATPAVQLPADYADPAKSGLSFELKDADQDYSLDL